MNDRSTKEGLLKQIEVLRTQLHDKVKKEHRYQQLTDHDLLLISRRLDDLIVKYMTMKNV